MGNQVEQTTFMLPKYKGKFAIEIFDRRFALPWNFPKKSSIFESQGFPRILLREEILEWNTE